MENVCTVQFEPTKWLPSSPESALIARTGNQLFDTPYLAPYMTIQGDVHTIYCHV
jgi:hypothetical protein